MADVKWFWAVALASCPLVAQAQESGGEILPISVMTDLPASDDATDVLVRIPEGVEAIKIALTADDDLDLYAALGAGFEGEPIYTADGFSAGHGGQEQIVLRPEGEVGVFSPGLLTLRVVRPDRTRGDVSYILKAQGITGEQADELPASTARPVPVEVPDVEGLVTGDMVIPIEMKGSTRYQTYVFDVTGGTRSVELALEGFRRDMDLHVRRGAPMNEYTTEPDASANGPTPAEMIYLDKTRTSPVRLRKGRWFVDVFSATQEDVSGRLVFRTNQPPRESFYREALVSEVITLSPGVAVHGKIEREFRAYQTFSVAVPAGVSSMYIQTANAEMDVDMYVKYGTPIEDFESDYDEKAYSGRLNERIVLEPESGGTLEPGLYYIDVVSFITSDEEVGFDLAVSFEKPLEGFMLDTIELTAWDLESLSGLERALISTVKIEGPAGSGSGTLLSKDGYILTNHHVVLDEEEDEVVEKVFVSVARAFDEAPEQLFEAKPVEYDEDLDLALLKITADILGRELPEGLEFPAAPIPEEHGLRIGQTLMVAGYPMVGGAASRSSISVTRGILSGWDNKDDDDRWLKTDARINAGNSGGSLIDGDGFLVGIPTKEIIQGDDELGYCRELSAVPEAWWALISHVEEGSPDEQEEASAEQDEAGEGEVEEG